MVRYWVSALLTAGLLFVAGLRSPASAMDQSQGGDQAVFRALFTPTPSGAGTLYRETLRAGGLRRSYLVYVPLTYSRAQAAPVVIALHGRLGQGQGMEQLTGFDALADREGFIVVYPDGYRRSWADGRGATPADLDGVDDVGFISALIDAVSGKWQVDQNRVFVAGMSNGGFMTQRLGCALSGKIAAIAVVAATLSTNTASRCSPARSLPVMYIHGTADPLVPIGGGDLRGGERGEILSLEASAQQWAALDGCKLTPTITSLPNAVSDGTSVHREIYPGCGHGAAVIVYVIEGGGHTWPGGFQYLPRAVIGRTSRNLDATQTIWEFFRSYAGN